MEYKGLEVDEVVEVDEALEVDEVLDVDEVLEVDAVPDSLLPLQLSSARRTTISASHCFIPK